MHMKIIRHREFIEQPVQYERRFWYEGHEGRWGCCFACDEHGNLFPMNEGARANYEQCITGTLDGEKVIDGGVRSYKLRGYWEPAIGLCSCGREVVLDGFTCTCDCGADYNSSGQRLGPRSSWGEETGESLADILNIP